MTKPVPSGWRFEVAFSAVFVLVLAAFWAHRLMEGFVFSSGDDFTRLGYAMSWAREPFFAPSDYLWLTGNFALLGGLVRAANDGLEGAFIFSMLSCGLLAWGLVKFARVSGAAFCALLIAALMAVASPQFRIHSLSALPDTLAWSLVLLSWASMVAGLSSRNSWRLASAPIIAALATTLRFECWLFGGAISVLCAGIAIHRTTSDKQSLWQLWVLLAACATPFIFPTLWMLSSAQNLGSPLAFASGGNNPLFRHYSWGGELRLAQGTPVTFGGRISDALFLLTAFLSSAGIPSAAAVAGLVLRRDAVRVWTLLLPLLWLGIVCAIAFRSGLSGNAPTRILLPAVVSVWLLGTAAIIEFARVKVLPLTAVGGLLLLAFVPHILAMHQGTQQIPNRGIRNDSMMMGWRLRQETSGSREFMEGISFRRAVQIWAPITYWDTGDVSAVAALAGDWNRVLPVYQQSCPVTVNENVSAFAELHGSAPLGFVLAERVGEWRLWLRASELSEQIDPAATLGGSSDQETLRQQDFGLEWMLHAPAEPVSFEQAQEYVETLNNAGHSDWRLPTMAELWKISAYCIDNEPGYDARLTPRARYFWSVDSPHVGTRSVVDFTVLRPGEKPESGLCWIRPVRTLKRAETPE